MKRRCVARRRRRQAVRPPRRSRASAGRARNASGNARSTQHTTHPVVLESRERVVVTRERHPLAGKTLEVIQRRRHRGEPHILLLLSDGSRLRVPECWTTAPTTEGATRGSLEVSLDSSQNYAIALAALLRARVLVDALLRQSATSNKEPAAKQPTSNRNEGKHAEPTPAVRAHCAREGSEPGLETTHGPTKGQGNVAVGDTDRPQHRRRKVRRAAASRSSGAQP